MLVLGLRSTVSCCIIGCGASFILSCWWLSGCDGLLSRAIYQHLFKSRLALLNSLHLPIFLIVNWGSQNVRLRSCIFHHFTRFRLFYCRIRLPTGPHSRITWVLIEGHWLLSHHLVRVRIGCLKHRSVNVHAVINRLSTPSEEEATVTGWRVQHHVALSSLMFDCLLLLRALWLGNHHLLYDVTTRKVGCTVAVLVMAFS